MYAANKSDVHRMVRGMVKGCAYLEQGAIACRVQPAMPLVPACTAQLLSSPAPYLLLMLLQLKLVQCG
jgi:hypothetical protein